MTELSHDGADLTETIRTVLADHGHLALDVRTLQPSENLYTAGLTSHAAINVMLAIEDATGIEFPDRLLQRSTFESIASIRNAVTEVQSGTVS